MFRPLGMKDTGFDVPSEKMNRLAKTYPTWTDGKFVEAERSSRRGRNPVVVLKLAGLAFFSTAGDYARFAKCC